MGGFLKILRILFASTRGTGHFSPLLPYAKELSRRGHQVAFAARVELADQIASGGFTHFALVGPNQMELEAIWARSKNLSGEALSKLYIQEIFCGVVARAALAGMQAAIEQWRPDLVVRESVEYSSIVRAQAAGIPHARVEVHNAHSEEKYSHTAVAALDLLRELAGLAVDDGKAYLNEPVFSSFPSALDGTAVRCCAPTFRVGPADVEKPNPRLDAAWAQNNGKPLLYMTFGTETQNMDQAKFIYRVALEAVADFPVRALLTTGKELAPEVIGAIPANTTVLAWVPQSEVFHLASALLHHGGSGTMLGGLAAGLPMVITPLFADQPSNATQVERAGAGIAVPNPTPETLRSALSAVLAGTHYYDAAKRVATELALMPKIEAAADKLLAPVAG